MKLINADKLKEYLRKEKLWCVKSPDGVYKNEGFTYDQVFFSIDMQQTVDAVAVVHGHWEKPVNDTIACSECCTWYSTYNSYLIPNKGYIVYPAYCPNCGAKMMEGEHDDKG